VHVAGNDGVPVQYMMSIMFPHQRQCLTEQFVPMSNSNV
jgi:hypothetical protein